MIPDSAVALGEGSHLAANHNCKGKVGTARLGNRDAAIIAFDYGMDNNEVRDVMKSITWVKMEYSDPLLDGTSWQYKVSYGSTPSDNEERTLGSFAVTSDREGHMYFTEYRSHDKKWVLLLQLTPSIVAMIEVHENGSARFLMSCNIKLLA